MTKKQKFKAGDFVIVTHKIPDYMSHFQKDLVGCVEGSYGDLYGGKNYKDYGVFQFDKGRCVDISWYKEEQLTKLSGHDIVVYFKECLEENDDDDEDN